jgi:putative addiction module component (TIGR02574 family)
VTWCLIRNNVAESIQEAIPASSDAPLSIGRGDNDIGLDGSVRIVISLAKEPKGFRTMATLDISRLTPKERLDLIGELWDSLSATDVQLTPAQEAELDRRLATFDADRREAIPWEDIEAEIDRRSR